MISVGILRHHLEANFDTGVLRRRKTGRVAGGIGGEGYRCVKVAGRKLQAHRVIWALAYGSWPPGPLDHINGKRADNRLANLRIGSGGINQRNAARSKRSTSGRTGVSWHKRRKVWHAYIHRSGQREHLGYFARFEDAVAARAKAEATIGYSPRHGAGRVTFRQASARRMPDGWRAYLRAELVKAQRLEDCPWC